MHRIKEILLGHIAEAAVVLLGIIGAIVAPILAKSLLPFVAESVTTLQWLKLVLALLALLFFAVLYIIVIYFKSKNPVVRLLKKYEFLEREGIYKKKNTDRFFCPSCLLNGVESPVKVMKQGWLCQKKDCALFVHNPDYTPPKQPRARGITNWATRI